MMIDPIPAQTDWGRAKEADPANQPVVEGATVKGATVGQHAVGRGGAKVKTSTAASERADSYDRELKPPPTRELIPQEEEISLLERMAIESQTHPEATVEGGLTAFFNSLIRGVGELIKVSAITLVSGILAAALLPFFGPVVAVGFSLGAVVVLIQDKLKLLGLDLQDDTIRKLVEPLQGKVIDESVLQKVIEEVLSKDRQANEDLAKAFIDLLPTIHKAAGATNIHISGPVQGLIVGNENTITQTFRGFLPKDTL